MSSTSGPLRESPSSADGLQILISRAKAGDREALGQALEASRDYLRVVSSGHLDEDVRAKLGASDLVQDTFMDAQRAFDQFRGTDRGELFAWLKQILVNNLLNHYRSLRATQKRRVSREVPLADAESPVVYPSDEAPSKLCVRREEAQLLEQAIQRLAPDHRQVIELRHRDRLSFADIGDQLGRSSDAARMLWYRAFEQLSAEIGRLTQ